MTWDIIHAFLSVLGICAGVGLWWLICIGPTEFLDRYTRVSHTIIRISLIWPVVWFLGTMTAILYFAFNAGDSC